MTGTSNSRYGSLLFLDEQEGPAQTLARLPFSGEGSRYDESHIRDLIFSHPEILPVAEIDPNYGRLIPVCRELRTPAGPIDAVFVNERGLLTLIECKLWRNPQARREVVGQILDYAKELGRWRYEDIQREVSSALKRPGNTLYDLVRERHPDVAEDVFVDSAARCLRSGRFLLLIVGDGIREGVETMVTFLQEHAGLHFTFGLVEVALFEAPQGGRIVQPRVLARTTLLERTVLRPLDHHAPAGPECPGRSASFHGLGSPRLKEAHGAGWISG